MDKKPNILSALKAIAGVWKSLSPLFMVAGAIIMLWLSTFITTKLAPLYEGINANTNGISAIVARAKEDEDMFNDFQFTISENLKDLANKLDSINTRLSRIEGKLE